MTAYKGLNLLKAWGAAAVAAVPLIGVGSRLIDIHHEMKFRGATRELVDAITHKDYALSNMKLDRLDGRQPSQQSCRRLYEAVTLYDSTLTDFASVIQDRHNGGRLGVQEYTTFLQHERDLRKDLREQTKYPLAQCAKS